MSDYSSLWDERVMKKGKKQHWGFTCPQCEKKFSSKSHTQYFLIEYYYLQMMGEPFSNEYETKLYCSEKCVLDHFWEKDINPDVAVKKIKEFWERMG